MPHQVHVHVLRHISTSSVSARQYHHISVSTRHHLCCVEAAEDG